jgi:hypothetical protein
VPSAAQRKTQGLVVLANAGGKIVKENTSGKKNEERRTKKTRATLRQHLPKIHCTGEKTNARTSDPKEREREKRGAQVRLKTIFLLQIKT